MKINPFYPICNEKPELVKEFFSGFFYLGRKKYVRLPSDPLELKVRQELNKSICARKCLENCPLYHWYRCFSCGILIQSHPAFSLVGKNITLLINEKASGTSKTSQGSSTRFKKSR